MKSEIVSICMNAANAVLLHANLELIRTWEKEAVFGDYIPFQSTVLSAGQAGLAVGDYIESRFGERGSTQDTIDRLAELGVYDGQINRVCEIGPGSGRYLEKTMRVCAPKSYEIYETAKDWERWLVRQYGVTALQGGGKSLGETQSGSVDLVQAHKVFCGLPVLAICHYFQEMVRVARSPGWIVFDILTENCLQPAILQAWIESEITYPCSMFPKQFAVDLFARRKCRFIGDFMVPMRPGKTEVMVFRKQ